MLVDYREHISPERRRHLDAQKEMLKALEPQVRVLVDDHKKNSKRWFAHEVLPWGMGQDFNDLPWEPGQAIVRPEIVMALETNLLTEDNLPYYHAAIERMMDKDSIWQDWNRLWTSEEGQHAQAMRDYLFLTRAMDPYEIERGRLMIMQAGFDRDFGDPMEIFTYTSAQELATRVSHLRAGQKADEPYVLKLMSLIARDENFHYVFYRSVVMKALEMDPNLVLPAIMKQFYSFSMPGSAMSNFELRQAIIADAGIYGAREHRDQVIRPLVKYWNLGTYTNLTPESAKAQERLMKLDAVLTRMVESQERRARKTDSDSAISDKGEPAI